MAALNGVSELTLSDGRKAVVRVDMGAMILIEEASGVSFAEILEQMRTKKVPLRTQRALFYGMLKQDMPELTVEAAGALLLKEAVAFGESMKAMEKSMPPAEAVDEEASPDGEADPLPTKAEAETST